MSTFGERKPGYEVEFTGLTQSDRGEHPLNAGEAFRFDEVEVGFRILREDPEFGLPIDPLSLGLQGSGSRQCCENGTARNSHGTTILRRRVPPQVFYGWALARLSAGR